MRWWPPTPRPRPWPRRKASQIALEAFTAGAARAAGRLGRPDRLQPHQHQPARRRCASTRRRAQRRAPHQLRRARVRHGRHHERRGAARRLHPLRRHLPDLQRLQPQRHPHGRADEARVVHVFTHDSIGLGEDGPTHQSVEHAASLRLIPGLDVWRPADTAETAVAWAGAIAHRAARARCCCRGRTCPMRPRPTWTGWTPSPRAPMCWPSRPRSA
jgi:hypothetical protein